MSKEDLESIWKPSLAFSNTDYNDAISFDSAFVRIIMKYEKGIFMNFKQFYITHSSFYLGQI